MCGAHQPAVGSAQMYSDGHSPSPGELPLEVEVSMKASSCSSILSSALPSSTAGACEACPDDACHAQTQIVIPRFST